VCMEGVRLRKNMKIRVCPFCRNKDLFSIPIDSRFGNDVKYVECLDCHAHGPLATTDEEAVKAWNKRTYDKRR